MNGIGVAKVRKPNTEQLPPSRVRPFHPLRQGSSFEGMITSPAAKVEAAGTRRRCIPVMELDLSEGQIPRGAHADDWDVMRSKPGTPRSGTVRARRGGPRSRFERSRSRSMGARHAALRSPSRRRDRSPRRLPNTTHAKHATHTLQGSADVQMYDIRMQAFKQSLFGTPLGRVVPPARFEAPGDDVRGSFFSPVMGGGVGGSRYVSPQREDDTSAAQLLLDSYRSQMSERASAVDQLWIG